MSVYLNVKSMFTLTKVSVLRVKTISSLTVAVSLFVAEVNV